MFIRGIPLPPELLVMPGFSRRQIQEHYRLYRGYVENINEIRSKLQVVDRKDTDSTYSEYRSLKVEESYAYNGVKLHELYFTNLGGTGVPMGPVVKALASAFGSFEAWEKDWRAAGLSARGWVLTSFDYDDRGLHNYLLDAHNEKVTTRIEPLLVLDMYEHAYFMDYGTDKEGYLAAFWRNIDWLEVNRRFMALRQ